MKLLDHPTTLKLVTSLAPVLGFLMGMWLIYNIETRFFPVVVDFQLDYIEKHDQNWTLGGSMRKTRACELLTINILAVPKIAMVPNVLVYQIRAESVMGGNMPTGLNTWGPWLMRVPDTLVENADKISHVQVQAIHRCHALWNQETHYLDIPLDKLKL